MTPQEFKAWFDGFTEAFDKAPMQKQWARIKERVAEIDGKPITERIYVDRYFPRYPYPYNGWPYGLTGISSCGTLAATNQTMSSAYAAHNSLQGTAASNTFDGATALYALGKAEAKEFSA